MFLSLLLALAPSALAQPTCTFTLNPTSRSVPATTDTIGTITVTASCSTCDRTAVSDSPDWLSISFGNTGTGNGSIGYRVETSDVAQIRTGSITVGNARFSVTQAAATCTMDLTPLSARSLHNRQRIHSRDDTLPVERDKFRPVAHHDEFRHGRWHCELLR